MVDVLTEVIFLHFISFISQPTAVPILLLDHHQGSYGQLHYKLSKIMKILVKMHKILLVMTQINKYIYIAHRTLPETSYTVKLLSYSITVIKTIIILLKLNRNICILNSYINVFLYSLNSIIIKV